MRAYENNARLPGFAAFKTGLTYQDVAAMFWVDSNNPDDWQQVSRGKILAAWHGIKLV